MEKLILIGLDVFDAMLCSDLDILVATRSRSFIPDDALDSRGSFLPTNSNDSNNRMPSNS